MTVAAIAVCLGLAGALGLVAELSRRSRERQEMERRAAEWLRRKVDP